MRILFLAFLIIPLFVCGQQNQAKTPEEVVSLIKKNVMCNWAYKTVNKFKTGNPVLFK